MGIRAGDAENLKKKGIGTKMEEKSKPVPSQSIPGCGARQGTHTHFVQDLSRETPAGILHKCPQICTTVHAEFD
jgi:hypothetical protein